MCQKQQPKRELKVGDFAMTVETQNIGLIVKEHPTGTFELHILDFYAIMINGETPEEAACSDDVEFHTPEDLRFVELVKTEKPLRKG